MQKEKTPRLSRDENVARGYAVYTPHGTYRKPITAKLKTYVDSGHLKVDEWGRPYITDQFDADIKAIVKPIPQSLLIGDSIDRMIADIEVDEINELSTKISNLNPNPLYYLLEEKPAHLVKLEAELQAKMDAYWTPERKAIQKANQLAQHEYEVAVAKIDYKMKFVISQLEKSKEAISNAMARKNSPTFAAAQDKRTAIIRDRKRSTESKIYAIFENKSGAAAHNAKYEIIMAIATYLGKGLDQSEIYSKVSEMVAFSAHAYKRPEKEFNRLFNSAVGWIHHKNQIKVFWDLLGWISEGMKNSKIRTKTKDQFYLIMLMIALHEAKDNESRGLVAFRYLTRLSSNVSDVVLDPRSTGLKLEAYAKFGYITYAKGEQGGVASRAGILPYTGTLTVADAKTAAEAVLSILQDSTLKTHLEAVLSEVTRVDVVSQESLTPPTYNDQDLENAVDDLLAVFVPISRSAADERIAERHIEEIPFREELAAAFEEQEKAEVEAAIRVKEFLASGRTFNPTEVARKPRQIHAEALV